MIQPIDTDDDCEGKEMYYCIRVCAWYYGWSHMFLANRRQTCDKIAWFEQTSSSSKIQDYSSEKSTADMATIRIPEAGYLGPIVDQVYSLVHASFQVLCGMDFIGLTSIYPNQDGQDWSRFKSTVFAFSPLDDMKLSVWFCSPMFEFSYCFCQMKNHVISRVAPAFCFF